MNNFDIIKIPLNTEKGNLQKEKYNQLTFEVDRRANSIEVKKAVKKIFGVEVQSVNMMNVKGKKKRRGNIIGKKRDWKKAIVRLMPGEEIEMFKGV